MVTDRTPTLLAPCVAAVLLLPLGMATVCPQEANEGENMGKDATGTVTVRWWGQACMSVTTEDGKCVVIDPFPEGFGYAAPTVEPVVCLVSHEHRDHNAVENLKGEPQVIRGVGKHEAAGFSFLGVRTYHDDQQGAKRGPNTVFVWEMGGLRLAHLGDLGHLLTEEQLRQIGRADVIMIPVGGYYTIDAGQAIKVAKQLSAKVVLPMHYKTPAVPSLPIAGIDEFIKAMPEDWKLEKPDTTSVTLTSDEVLKAGTRAIVLKLQ